jgi:hypothetical protein
MRIEKSLKVHTGAKQNPSVVHSVRNCLPFQLICKRHLRVHSLERPDSCSQCSKSFAQADELLGHCRNHTIVKSHCCAYCSKSFAQSGGLRKHIRAHTGRIHIPKTCRHIWKLTLVKNPTIAPSVWINLLWYQNWRYIQEFILERNLTAAWITWRHSLDLTNSNFIPIRLSASKSPEVLVENNLEPFLIYQRALFSTLEARIVPVSANQFPEKDVIFILQHVLQLINSCTFVPSICLLLILHHLRRKVDTSMIYPKRWNMARFHGLLFYTTDK